MARFIQGLSDWPVRILPISPRSMPAQNVSPRPVRIATRRSSLTAKRRSSTSADVMEAVGSRLESAIFLFVSKPDADELGELLLALARIRSSP